MSEFIPQNSCADPEDQNRLSIDDARQRIASLITPLTAWQRCPIRDALGRILLDDIISPLNVPAHNNSAMDGYAIRSIDITNDSFSLKKVGIAFAGQPFQGTVNAGECIRIMTGAVVPSECDTIVMQEQVAVTDNIITIHGKQPKGNHVRYIGEDLKTGDVVLSAGRRIIPADLGLIASLGIAEVNVSRRLRVAFFSTGDELKSIGETLATGQIYDSNRYTLYGMLKRLDVEVLDMGVVPDQKEPLRQTLLQAAEQADVIISSGGVSVGDADYVKEMLAELGQVDFWKIAMRPGRPLAFGQINDSLFFGLPGNPVSVMVTFYQFVAPALRKLMGETEPDVTTFQVNCTDAIRKRPGRFEYQRAILFRDNDGSTKVKITGSQGSGILRSMSTANCFILLDEKCDGIAANSLVTVQPFSGLI
ncbi:MAG: molybdopterin-binding protein [Pseudomonadota bacterium]|nr:molybdopterin-binding protein [Pseudomonadota bacterium]MDO7710353.1 molybdopterin-binding protein [Pseudomonadota bacterium]